MTDRQTGWHRPCCGRFCRSNICCNRPSRQAPDELSFFAGRSHWSTSMDYDYEICVPRVNTALSPTPRHTARPTDRQRYR